MVRPRARSVRVGVLVGALSLVAAGCAKTAKTATSPTSPTSHSPMESPMQSMMPSGGGEMMLQQGAENMKVAITAPADGTRVTDNLVTLTVTTSGYQDNCDTAGKANVAGQGHYHISIDQPSNLVDMFCTAQATISMQNLNPGMHKLIAQPTQNDHTEVEHNANAITIDYEPTNPAAAITDATFAGKPSIKITNLTPGQTVSGAFDVDVQIANYHVNCDLEAKPDVVGYGHWHLNADSMTGGMMRMGTMMRMGCSNVIHTSTVGWKTGETHTLIALLVDNNHAPLNPPIDDKVQVKVG